MRIRHKSVLRTASMRPLCRTGCCCLKPECLRSFPGAAYRFFFLLSAVLLFRAGHSYGEVIRKKAKTLLVPYLLWNTFWIIVFVVLQSLSFTAPYFSGSNTPILQCSLKEWFGLYGVGQEYPQCYPLWFMRDLMAVILIFPLIKMAADRYPKAMFCIGVAFNILPVSFCGKTAFSWFLIGAAVVQMKCSLMIFDKYSMLKITGLYFGCAAASLLWNPPVIRTISIFAGIVFWLRLSKEIYAREKLRQIFLRLSECVFMIYVLHEMTLSSVRKLCFRLLRQSRCFGFWNIC